MGTTFIGFILGLVAGTATGTASGAFAGAALGMLLGISIHAALWTRARSGDAPVTERHRVMCTPLGTTADCDVVGDLERRRWYDVQRCSLLPATARVDCDKGCVQLLNLAGVRPGGACACSTAAMMPTARHGIELV